MFQNLCHFKFGLVGVLLGTINLLPGVRQRLLIDLWTSFIVLNCQLVKWVDIFANPVFKDPGIYGMKWYLICVATGQAFILQYLLFLLLYLFHFCLFTFVWVEAVIKFCYLLTYLFVFLLLLCICVNKKNFLK